MKGVLPMDAEKRELSLGEIVLGGILMGTLLCIVSFMVSCVLVHFGGR